MCPRRHWQNLARPKTGQASDADLDTLGQDALDAFLDRCGEAADMGVAHGPGIHNPTSREASGIALERVGQVPALPPQCSTFLASQHMKVQHEKDGLFANRNPSDRGCSISFEGHISASTFDTSLLMLFLVEMDVHGSAFILDGSIGVCACSICVIDKARGHQGPPGTYFSVMSGG